MTQQELVDYCREIKETLDAACNPNLNRVDINRQLSAVIRMTAHCQKRVMEG